LKKNLKLLVVDDDEIILNTLASFLEDEGFVIYPCSNAEQALEIVSKEIVDAGIIDIRLPGMDGDEFIIKAHGLNNSIRFIIYTGSITNFYNKSLLGIGMKPEDIIYKPVLDMDIILKAINRVLSL